MNFKGSGGDEDALVESIIDRVLILFGSEILKVVPGRVSTETDARLSFDTEGTIAKARTLIDIYEKSGIDRSRILIKIASTWEGIKAAEVLQKEKNQLQSYTDVLAGPGDRLCRIGHQTGIAFRGSHLRLV